MQGNIERKFLIHLPQNLLQAFLNIRLDPFCVAQKYVNVMLPTFRANQLPENPPQQQLEDPHSPNMNIEMSLALAGSSFPPANNQITIMQ